MNKTGIITEFHEVLRDNLKNGSYCTNNVIPTVSEYLLAINTYGIILFTLGSMAVLLTWVTYLDTLKYIIKNSPSSVKTHSAFLLGVYPMIAMTMFCSMVVPRAHLLAEAMAQGIFMVAMYQLFCLFVAYCEGESELIRKVKPNSLDLKVGPCCCWPCCCCLPMIKVDKNTTRILRLMVLQLSVVQCIVYLVLLVLWAEKGSLYELNYLYAQPICAISTLIGIWGIVITLRLLKDVLSEYQILSKFIIIQLVLLFTKVQAFITKFAVYLNLMPCNPPITQSVYANLIHSSLVVFEMAALGLLARKIYRNSTPECTAAKNISPVCVMNTQITTIGQIMNDTEIAVTEQPNNNWKY